MWSNKPHKNWNDYCHLNPETLRFVAVLRDADKQRSGDDEVKRTMLTAEQLSLVGGNKKKGLYDTKVQCKDEECLGMDAAFALVIEERTRLLALIEQRKVIVMDNEDFNKELSERLNELNNEHIVLGNRFEDINGNFLRLKEKAKANNESWRQLSVDISRTQKEIQRLTSDEESKLNANKKKSQSMLYEHMSITKSKKEPKLRHSGRYTVIANGSKAWSCCMQGEEDALGCTEVPLTTSEPPKSLLTNNLYHYYTSQSSSISNSVSEGINRPHSAIGTLNSSSIISHISSSNIGNANLNSSITNRGMNNNNKYNNNNNNNNNNTKQRATSAINKSRVAQDLAVTQHNNSNSNTQPNPHNSSKTLTFNMNGLESSMVHNSKHKSSSDLHQNSTSNLANESSLFTSNSFTKFDINGGINSLNRSVNESRAATSSGTRNKTKISPAELLKLSNKSISNFHNSGGEPHRIGDVRVAYESSHHNSSGLLEGDSAIVGYEGVAKGFRKNLLSSSQGPHLLKLPSKGTPLS